MKPVPKEVGNRPPIKIIGIECDPLGFAYWFKLSLIGLLITAAIAYGVGK